MGLRVSCLVVAFVFLAAGSGFGQDGPVWRDAGAPVEARVDDLLGRLTLEEKVFICHGNFLSGGVERLGIGQLKMLDGRQGLRPNGPEKGMKATSMPSVLNLSCTWDESAAWDYGRVLAEEMLAMDRHVLLAPMLNLIRSPLGGRNFENFGEDPLLVGMLGSAYIEGVQDQGVGACSCLLVANDCERKRHFTSSNMDDRTLRELHLLPYELSVREGKVWSMMTGNNLFNGVHCAHNGRLIQELMKDEIGFDGVMITDWRAAYDTVPAALAGTDMTTGFCGYVFGEGNLLAAVKSGEVSEELLEEKARRVLRLYVRSGVLEGEMQNKTEGKMPSTRGRTEGKMPSARRSEGEMNTEGHHLSARRLGAEGMVLLRNAKGLLPLDGERLGRVLVTGPAAGVVLQGGGSGGVPAYREVTAVDGLRAALAGKAEVVYLEHAVEMGANRGARQEVAAGWYAKAAEAAREADVVVYVAAGERGHEGRDLSGMELPGNQAETIAAMGAANERLVVVLVSNGAVSLEGWGEKAGAIVAAHYAGQATGEALADVLTGAVNPGGKLSYTWGRRLGDYAVHAVGEWPARLVLDEDPGSAGFTPEERKATHAYSTDYKEGVFGGYRWFDEEGTAPVFPFGYGLSYTSFEISGLEVRQAGDCYRVACVVKNTGDRAGAEVVQVYVRPVSAMPVERPVRELKGFAKVRLAAGEARRVEVSLRAGALAFYDVAAGQWRAAAGEYEIEVGNSSRDLGLQERVVLEEDRWFEHY